MSNLYHYNRKRAKAKRQAQKRALKPFKVVVYNTTDPTRATVERFSTYQSAQEYCDAINRDALNVRAYIE